MKEAGRRRELGWRCLGVLAAAVVAFSYGCKKTEQMEGTTPKAFPSPESAGQAVYNAAKAGDTNAVLAIFGPECREYLLTEDPSEDKAALDSFAEDYQKMHRWGSLEGDAAVLEVGTENYPFPFPLVKTADGQWMFSADRAKEGNASKTDRRQRTDGYGHFERDGGRTGGIFQQPTRRQGETVRAEISQQRGQTRRSVLDGGGG